MGAGDRLLSLADLEREAGELWRGLPQGAVLWLSGEIGTGKTTLVQAIVRAAGATRAARSPTFALVHEYASPEGPILHVDCYRLNEPDEARDLDFRELLRQARLLVIEWPERAGRHAPRPDLHLRLSHVDLPDRRLVERVA